MQPQLLNTGMKEQIYKNKLSIWNKAYRFTWNICYIVLFRPFCGNIFRKWRLLILKIFGAKIDMTANIYSSAKIWMPSHLIMKRYSCIAESVRCYNVGVISIAEHATVSQGAYLCTASHDIESQGHELIIRPIKIENNAWVASDAFVGMGVTIGEGAVVGARAAVFKDVEPWTVVGGNPAKPIKKREIRK